jgi:endoglucanase
MPRTTLRPQYRQCTAPETRTPFTRTLHASDYNVHTALRLTPLILGKNMRRLIKALLVCLVVASQGVEVQEGACSPAEDGLNAPRTADLAPDRTAIATSRLAIRVQGNHLVDSTGQLVQLRGANVSGLENTAIQGWAKKPDGGYENWADANLGAEPDWSKLVSWKMNVVRLPLNEASWLGYRCNAQSGSMRSADPGGNYQATVKQSVLDANAAGLYVILDLHWSAPQKVCPEGQAPMADKDNSIAFWISVANAFKGNPAVIFELFNEPFGHSEYPVAMLDWQALRDGGSYFPFAHQSSSTGLVQTSNLSWQAAGMQAMLNAVRSTGATNVVLAGTMGWCGDLSRWLSYKPIDPAGQLAAAWHAYPWGSDSSKPAWSGVGDQYKFAAAITAQMPVVITETGHSFSFARALFAWADHNPSLSYLVWAWNPWGPWDLIKDANGNPTDFGIYYRAHLACVADRIAVCP